jgi:uncharacterized repeat protein (TIGR03803 family)
MRMFGSTLRLTRVVAAILLLFGSVPSWGGAKYRVLHNFGSGKDGCVPRGPLILDDRGNLYGATGGGGMGGCDSGYGTVYRLVPRSNGTWNESILHSFKWGNDGAIPWGPLAFDRSGNLYGTLYGEPGTGMGVFQLSHTAAGWNNTVLYSDGAGPGLLMDGLGNLYGEMGPGQYQGGAIGELSPGADGWTYTPLHSFDGYDGLIPMAPPMWDGKGNMFGTTAEGGIYKSPCQTYLGCGVIFEMRPNGDGTWIYHVVHRFASFKDDGQNPYSGLVMDKAGNFYGATIAGGAYGFGTVFKFANTGGKWKETILHNFSGDCTYGCGVEGTLARDKAGNLYGTAGGGTGSCNPYTCGVVFKLSPQKNGKWKYRVLYNFTAAGGGFQPFYGVIVDDKSHLFGVTSQFGKYGFGTAFEIIQ